MARGESPKERPQFPGAAIMASFLAFCLCAITGVAMTTRECNAVLTPTPPIQEPFVGTIATFHALSWRDSERVRTTIGVVAPDAVRARSLLESTLATRGYTPAATEGLAAVSALPADFDAPSMQGSCGVLVVLGDGAAVLARAEVTIDAATETFVAHDPSVLAVPICGAQRVHVEGTGSAGAHVWHFPGLTPDIVRDTALPVDVVLAHAEAEGLLRGRGLAPLDEVAVIDVPSGTGPQAITITRSVGTGCVPFVGVVVGGGDAIGAWSPVEHLTDRALLGLAACATRTDVNPTITVPTGTARVYLRPYRAIGGGAPPVIGAAASLRIVDEANLVLPAALVEAPMP